MSIATTWGTTAEERAMTYPCDAILTDAHAAYYRGLTVNAPAAILFRWLCQLRVAPYSYDWIDNLGRQSPQELTPGLDELQLGQRLMGQFDLVDFERDRHITVRTLPNSSLAGLFGAVAATYLVLPVSANESRLLVKVLARFPRGPIGWLIRVLLPWGDLIMMRRQLLNLGRLAEQSAISREGVMS